MRLRVSGRVVDDQGNPVEDAEIIFYGVKETPTLKDGCFSIGGVLAGPGFDLKVVKPGFKDYWGAQAFKDYDITVTLSPVSSSKDSTATWRVLKEDAFGPCERGPNQLPVFKK